MCLPSTLAWFCASVRLHQQASRGNKTCWHLAANKSPEQANNPKPDFNGLIIQRFLLGSRWNSCSSNGWNPARLDDSGFRSFSVWSLTSCRRPEVSSDASSESVLPKVLEDFCILAGRIRGQLCVMVNGNIRTGSTNWSLSLCQCRYVQGGNSIRLYRHGCTYWLLLRILRPTSGDGCGIDLGCLGGESSVTWQPDPIICFFLGKACSACWRSCFRPARVFRVEPSCKPRFMRSNSNFFPGTDAPQQRLDMRRLVLLSWPKMPEESENLEWYAISGVVSWWPSSKRSFHRWD